jgi:hypothetical protein
MALKLTEQFLAGSGSVTLPYFLTPSEKRPHLEILVIRYTGEYPSGSGGNADAIYMHAMAKAAVTAFGPFGVIHDFSELMYEWGDLLEMVFTVGPAIERSPDDLQRKVFGVSPETKASPVAIVVGPGCEEAIRTLFHGVGSSEPIDTVGWVFRDVQAAWRFVADRIG